MLDVFLRENGLLVGLFGLEAIEVEGASFNIFGLIFVVGASSGPIHEGFGNKILHDNFIPLNLLLGFNFDIFEFVFGLGVLEPGLDFIDEFFDFFDFSL